MGSPLEVHCPGPTKVWCQAWQYSTFSLHYKSHCISPSFVPTCRRLHNIVVERDIDPLGGVINTVFIFITAAVFPGPSLHCQHPVGLHLVPKPTGKRDAGSLFTLCISQFRKNVLSHK